MNKRWKFWIAFAVPVLFLAAVGLAYRPVVVEGNSMEPTLHPRQMVLMDRHPSLVPRRGDIVVLEYNGETLIKRVYAVGGDVLEMALFRNGSMHPIGTLPAPPDDVRRRASDRPWEMRIARMVVPPGHIFVVGDNLRASGDSRQFGPVPVEDIRGYVLRPGEALRHLPRRLRAGMPRAKANAPQPAD